MNTTAALNQAIRDLQTIPGFQTAVLDKIAPADMDKMKVLVARVTSEAPAVPHLGEQKLPWIARGAMVCQMCKKIMLPIFEQSLARSEARALMNEADARADIAKEIREDGLFPRHDMTEAEKEAFINALVPLKFKLEPVNLAVMRAMMQGLKNIQGTTVEQVSQLVDLGMQSLVKMLSSAQEKLFPFLQDVGRSVGQFMRPQDVVGLQMTLGFASLFLPKIQKAAEEVATTVQKVTKVLLEVPAPAAAPAAASASSSSAAAAAPEELPYIARFFSEFVALTRQLESLPAADSVADLAAVEKVKDEAEITLQGVDLNFKQLEAMGKECKNLKKLTLGENVTLAGSKHFDKEAVEFFFEGVEVTGAPCAAVAGRMKELMSYNEALNVSKEQLWKYVLSLHQAAHAAHADLHEPAHAAWADGATEKLRKSGQEILFPFFDSIARQFSLT